MKAIKDYLETGRNDWLLKHKGQCVLNCSQVHWTTEVEECILQGPEAIKEYFDGMEK
jgi:dynein heavy chain